MIAGELGIANGREDRYPDAVHKLHAHMGSIQLQQGARRDAWKHLLSAAFGLPEDGPLNLDLARCYEEDGRFSRAYSRYLQALLSPESKCGTDNAGRGEPSSMNKSRRSTARTSSSTRCALSSASGIS